MSIRNSSNRRRFPLQRAAFTLIELLVVIGIIAVLVGIAVYSFNRLNPSEKATKATLANCRAMFAEFEAISGIGSTPPEVFYRNQRYLKTSAQFGDFWIDPYAGDSGESPIQLPPSTAAAPVAFKISNRQNLGTDVLRNTVLAMSLLKNIPANRDTMAKLPSKSVMNLTAQDATTLNTAADEIKVPLVADAWGSPVVFVPGNGLKNVNVGRNPDGTYPTGSVNLVIRAPDNRPFFASAGPDGDLSSGDDNVYSFNQ